MLDYELIKRMPTVEEMITLRESVEWSVSDKELLQKGLENSLFGICAIVDNKVIGTARVVGDGATAFYVQDVIVSPPFQRMGIGNAMMEGIMGYIGKNACNGANVGLMSAKGKEEFYEKFGFWRRPTEKYGAGMMQFWKKEDQAFIIKYS